MNIVGDIVHGINILGKLKGWTLSKIDLKHSLDVEFYGFITLFSFRKNFTISASGVKGPPEEHIFAVRMRITNKSPRSVVLNATLIVKDRKCEHPDERIPEIRISSNMKTPDVLRHIEEERKA